MRIVPASTSSTAGFRSPTSCAAVDGIWCGPQPAVTTAHRRRTRMNPDVESAAAPSRIINAFAPTSASHEPVVLRMATDPEPHHPAVSVHAEGSVVKSNPHGVKAVHSLEMKRGMFWIAFEQLKVTIRELADGQG